MSTKTLPLLLPLLTFLLLLHKCLSIINPHYEACKPFECGSLSISYPFYFPTTQPSFCGSEGFNVSCSPQNHTIFNLSGDDYIIHDIYYNDLSINITNLAFSSSVFGCLSSVHNLTLGQDSKFNFTPNHKELLLLQNCSSKNIASSGNIKKMQCKKDGEAYDLFAVYEEQFSQEEVGKCNESVEVPYDDYEGEQASPDDIQGLLKKGIILNYTAYNCSKCRDSGGRCGFNQNTMTFLCACPDGDHISQCQQVQQPRARPPFH